MDWCLADFSGWIDIGGIGVYDRYAINVCQLLERESSGVVGVLTIIGVPELSTQRI